MSSSISLKSLNTLGVTAFAEQLIETNSTESLIDALRTAKTDNIKPVILGGGSNVILANNSYKLVIRCIKANITVLSENADEVILSVSAGTTWDDLVEYTVNNNLFGIENLSFIPGSVGAAPIQNIGAYGQELSDVLLSLDAISREDLTLKHFTKEACEFSYRNSFFKKSGKDKYLITEIQIKLSKTAKYDTSYHSLKKHLAENNITDITLASLRKVIGQVRSARLPDFNVNGNAGSFFLHAIISLDKFKKLKEQLPDLPHFNYSDSTVKIPSGYLVSQCDTTAFKTSKLSLYPNNPNVIIVINGNGEVKGSEIIDFAENIIQTVKQKFDVQLSIEPNIIK